jgi:hypothetical protein
VNSVEKDEFSDALLGLAKNERLKAEIQKEMEQAKAQYQETGHAARLFKEFVYQTRVGVGHDGWWPRLSIWRKARTRDSW